MSEKPFSLADCFGVDSLLRPNWPEFKAVHIPPRFLRGAPHVNHFANHDQPSSFGGFRCGRSLGATPPSTKGTTLAPREEDDEALARRRAGLFGAQGRDHTGVELLGYALNVDS